MIFSAHVPQATQANNVNIMGQVPQFLLLLLHHKLELFPLLRLVLLVQLQQLQVEHLPLKVLPQTQAVQVVLQAVTYHQANDCLFSREQ